MRRIPPPIAQIGEALTVDAGGYLRNTVRAAGVTCAMCATPTDGYLRCYPCKQHVSSGEPTADQIGTMVYAVKNAPPAPRDQTYVAMYGYKGRAPQEAHTRLVRSLVALGVAGHWECAAVDSGRVPTRWAAVPGTQHTDVEHPLHAMVADLFASAEYELPIQLQPGAAKLRHLRSEHFQVTGAVPRDAHVMVIDDSWVTGSSAQSVAIALKRAGVSEVSILALARVLGPDWAPNAAFLKSDHARRDFDYTICPWTGDACP